jgi:hypothetical protein
MGSRLLLGGGLMSFSVILSSIMILLNKGRIPSMVAAADPARREAPPLIKQPPADVAARVVAL